MRLPISPPGRAAIIALDGPCPETARRQVYGPLAVPRATNRDNRTAVRTAGAELAMVEAWVGIEPAYTALQAAA